MGELSNTISTLSAILFLASTVINIYLTMRLSKLENSMNLYIESKIKEAKEEIDSDIKEARVELRDQVRREIDFITERLNRMKIN